MKDQQIRLFTSEDGEAQLEVALDRETVWLNQSQICELFGRERSVITKHIRNVFTEGELERDSVCAKFAHTAADGKTYQVGLFQFGRDHLCRLSDTEEGHRRASNSFPKRFLLPGSSTMA